MERTPDLDSPVPDTFLRALAANPEMMADLIQKLHRRVRDSDTLLDLMNRVTSEAVRLVPGVEWAGVTARLAGRAFTAARTDPRVLVVDDHQYAAQDGPCLRAMHAGLHVNVSAAEVSSTWPGLAATARSVGIYSFVSLPVPAQGSSTGSLNLYSPDSSVDDPDKALMAVLVGYLSRGFADFIASCQAPAGEAAVRTALVNRGRIEQAVGVMMDRYGFSAEYSRDVLDDQALDSGRTLAQEATKVIQQSAAPGP
jgi:hypothetical protein